MKQTALLVAALILSASCTAEAPGQTPDVESQSAVITQNNGPKHLGANGVASHMDTYKNAVILDVRTPKEYNAGHIDGAINVDFKAADFKEQLTALDRNTPYLVHCRSGRRSTLALPILAELGFTDIAHLDGGIKGWQEAGFQLTEPCSTC
ncbi:MAG: rhodanese-like domain-containing protein [Acidimicrobiales bacterium]|nr:rhodanese-like domain-containing protein [Hyphomonadaceae bacterium]RZV35404.1 MAG: rhodanese-like domain-containing protein [Acidimicrobiales bacterium]